MKEKIPEVEQVLLVHEVSSELLDMARKILSRSGGSDDRAAGKRVPDGTAHRSYGDRRQYGDRYKVLRRL